MKHPVCGNKPYIGSFQINGNWLEKYKFVIHIIWYDDVVISFHFSDLIFSLKYAEKISRIHFQDKQANTRAGKVLFKLNSVKRCPSTTNRYQVNS